MNKRTQAYARAGAILLACFLLLFVGGCRKKQPAPPPPPPPKTVEAPPPAPAKPVINSFTAEPRSIERGQSATLRWSVGNATDVSIDQGVGAVQSSGSRSVYPSTTTTYTLVANGPGGSDTRSVTIDVAAPAPPPPPPPKVTRSAEDWLASEVQDVYFDYDRSDIRDDARAVLSRNAEVLKQIFSENPNFTVQVEGHADERGSAEYNLGLGDRRATSTKDYLTQLGVPADRLRTISYGKERPVCTDANESCYQRNRRGHFAAAQ
jgi:peptidoglycan-associated lipoprotein